MTINELKKKLQRKVEASITLGVGTHDVTISNVNLLIESGRFLINLTTPDGKKVSQIASFNLLNEKGFELFSNFIGDTLGEIIPTQENLVSLVGLAVKASVRQSSEGYLNLTVFAPTRAIKASVNSDTVEIPF